MSRHVLLAAACCAGLAAPGAALADGTATGTVTRMPATTILIMLPHGDGTVSYCRSWEGTVTTSTGETVDFHVQTPLMGTLDSDAGLVATDEHAVQVMQTLMAARYGPPAIVTISYVDAVKACGLLLTNIVTSASATLIPQPCVVPVLTGMSLASAKRVLKGSSCTAGPITRRRSRTVPKGSVISTSPKKGSKRAPGAAVALVVSRGP
jgi:hypothetical protein